jgi:hypothetical protein
MQWGSGSRPGKQLNAAAGRRTAVAAGQVFNAPGGAPGIRGTPAGRLLSRAAGKNRAARRQKTVAKTVNYFTSESSILSSVAQERGQLPDEKCDALPLRAEKLSLPQSGDSDLEVAQRAAGVIRLATLCAQSQKRILELERELASQSEELVDLQAHPFFNLRDKYRDQILFWGWGMGFLCFIYWMLVS